MNSHYTHTIISYIDDINAPFECTFECDPSVYPVIMANSSTPLTFVYTCIANHVPLTSFYNPNLDETFWWGFCEVFPHHVDWIKLCQNTSLSENFWHSQCNMHTDRIAWHKLCVNPSLTDSFWTREVHRLSYFSAWGKLCKSTHLSCLFWDQIESKYSDDLDWDALSETASDTWFIEKYLSKVSWRCLAWNPSCTLSFWYKHCEEHGNRVDWRELCLIYEFPSAFWERFENQHGHKWDWVRLSSNSGISAHFWETRLDKAHWGELSFNTQLTADFWTRYIHRANLTQLSKTYHLPQSFWEEQCRIRPHKLGWYSLMLNTSLNSDFWEYQVIHNSQYIDWCNLSMSHLPLSFWKKRMDKLHWSHYAYHANLSPREWVDHADLVDVNDVAWNNRSTPVEFWEKINFEDMLSPYRRPFVRDRDLPLTFWRKNQYLCRESDMYYNPHTVKQLVQEQMYTFLSPTPPAMNAYYVSIMAEYIDFRECSFEYTLPELSFSVDHAAYSTLPTSMFLNFLSTHDHDLIDWKTLSMNADGARLVLLEHEFSHRIDWKSLAYNTHTDHAFWFRMAEKFPECVEFDILAFNQKPGEEFWEQYNDRVTMSTLSWNPFLSENFWRCENRLALANWTGLSCNNQLSIEFWKEHYSYLDVNVASLFNTTLDESYWRWVIEEHPRTVPWNALSRFFCLSASFWDEHFDRILWYPLCQFNTYVGEQFWERHVDRVIWSRLAANTSVPFSFFERHNQHHLHHANSPILPSTPFSFIREHLEDYDDEDIVAHPDCPWREYPQFKEHWRKTHRIVNELMKNEVKAYLLEIK